MRESFFVKQRLIPDSKFQIPNLMFQIKIVPCSPDFKLRVWN